MDISLSHVPFLPGSIFDSQKAGTDSQVILIYSCIEGYSDERESVKIVSIF